MNADRLEAVRQRLRGWQPEPDNGLPCETSEPMAASRLGGYVGGYVGSGVCSGVCNNRQAWSCTRCGAVVCDPCMQAGKAHTACKCPGA